MPNINDIKDFHLDTASSIALLETLGITHSLWPEPKRFVSNHGGGFDALDERNRQVSYEFAPLLVQKGSTSDDLDQSINVTLGDLGQEIPPLIKQINDAGSDERPELVYRSYAFDASSNQLVNNRPIDIIKGLSIGNVSRDYQATTFEASTTDKNGFKTGRTYDFVEYPDLEGNL